MTPASPIVFAPGETRITLTITPVDDAVRESPESVELRLGAPSAGTVGDDLHIRTIGNND